MICLYDSSCYSFSQLVQGSSNLEAFPQMQSRTPLATVTPRTHSSVLDLPLSALVFFYLFPWCIFFFMVIISNLIFGICRMSKVRSTLDQLKKVCLWILHRFMAKQLCSQSLDLEAQVTLCSQVELY